MDTHYISRARQNIISDRKLVSDKFSFACFSYFLIFTLYFSHTQGMNSTKL